MKTKTKKSLIVEVGQSRVWRVTQVVPSREVWFAAVAARKGQF